MRILLSITTLAAAALAQNPMTADIKGNHTQALTNVLKAAEKMPEEHYGFAPTPEVRTFARLIGHVADASMMFCSAAKSEKVSPRGFEKSATTKTALVAAVKEAMAYCDGAYEGMTDAKGASVTKLMGRDRTVLGVLAFNNMHNYEHYGNIVTYMRLKGIVPPSSEGR